MERKQDKLLPIGEAFGGLDGLVQAVRDASPQARDHYRLRDQVDALVRASESEPDLGFMARWLMLCSFPRTNPGNRIRYKRVNGPFTLYMTAGGGNKLPFGNLPRLLGAWVCTEAVRTQSRELVLGHSLAEFMRTLGVLSSDSGGESGIRTRLRNQMQRFFNAHIQVVYQADGREASVSSPIASETDLWWSARDPDAPMLWQSKIELGEKFFQEIMRHPVPLDLNALKALKRSPLGLDLYMWLTYRTFNLAAPVRLSWPTLYRQFGVDPDRAGDNRTVQDFRKDCLRELIKIKSAWTGLQYRIERGSRGKKTGALVLLPSVPQIQPITRIP